VEPLPSVHQRKKQETLEKTSCLIRLNQNRNTSIVKSPWMTSLQEDVRRVKFRITTLKSRTKKRWIVGQK